MLTLRLNWVMAMYLPSRLKQGRAGQPNAGSRLDLDVIGDATDAAAAGSIGAGIDDMRFVEIDGQRISRPSIPGPVQVKIGHGQSGDGGVSQLLEVRRGQLQRPGQLRCLLQSFEALESLAGTSAQAMRPCLGDECLPELLRLLPLALLGDRQCGNFSVALLLRGFAACVGFGLAWRGPCPRSCR